jgi:hypothetical protein
LCLVPYFSVREALVTDRKADVRSALASPLNFRIPTIDSNIVLEFGNIFQLARSEFQLILEHWLRGVSVGGGDSETTTVIDDAKWLELITVSCGAVATYLNQKDAPSMVQLRSDVSQYVNGAMFLKVGQKAKQQDLGVACEELVDKMSNEAHRAFPRGSNTVVGVASAGGLVEIVLITPGSNGQYRANMHTHFNVTLREQKVQFLTELMKYLRFVVTIERPNSDFHLIPGLRRETSNGHHVTWDREGLLKEYRRLRSPLQMQYLQDVYAAQLPHVERGIIPDPKIHVARILSLGRKLSTCIGDGTVSKGVAFDHIASAVNELHSIGYAHCDICVNNCFVDTAGVVFLDDLEYVRPADMPPPTDPGKNHRLPFGAILPPTARELDILQLQSFQLELLRL